MNNYDVAAYIWPSYHYEPRVEHFWPVLRRSESALGNI